MAVTANVQAFVSISDEVATSIGSSNAFSAALNFSFSMTNPQIDTVFGERIALTAGAATVNLVALARSGRATLDLTGKTVFGYALRNNGANSMTFVAAVANPYALFPATTPTTIGAGDFVITRRTAGYGVVGTSARDITVAGTLVQTFDLILWAGTV